MNVLTFDMSGTASGKRARHAIAASPVCWASSGPNGRGSELAFIADQSECAAKAVVAPAGGKVEVGSDAHI